uniref:Uncharacterized protein n=1 Tax=Anopheles atroparvus TaxID=41427 RepID=A0A182JF56_ANOAO
MAWASRGPHCVGRCEPLICYTSYLFGGGRFDFLSEATANILLDLACLSLAAPASALLAAASCARDSSTALISVAANRFLGLVGLGSTTSFWPLPGLGATCLDAGAGVTVVLDVLSSEWAGTFGFFVVDVTFSADPAVVLPTKVAFLGCTLRLRSQWLQESSYSLLHLLVLLVDLVPCHAVAEAVQLAERITGVRGAAVAGRTWISARIAEVIPVAGPGVGSQWKVVLVVHLWVVVLLKVLLVRGVQRRKLRLATPITERLQLLVVQDQIAQEGRVIQWQRQTATLAAVVARRKEVRTGVPLGTEHRVTGGHGGGRLGREDQQAAEYHCQAT